MRISLLSFKRCTGGGREWFAEEAETIGGASQGAGVALGAGGGEDVRRRVR